MQLILTFYRRLSLTLIVEYYGAFYDILFYTTVLLTIDVDLVDHVHEFLLCGVLTETTHYHTQLLGADITITVLVEQLECFTDLCNTHTNKVVVVVVVVVAVVVAGATGAAAIAVVVTAGVRGESGGEVERAGGEEIARQQLR